MDDEANSSGFEEEEDRESELPSPALPTEHSKDFKMLNIGNTRIMLNLPLNDDLPQEVQA
jgi:hypothetical protein